MRTLFNVLGPLTNPARVRRQVLGVYDAALCEPLAKALQQLGSTHALVLHSEDGLDEISVASPTHGVELKGGVLAPMTIEPSDYGHGFESLDGLQVETADASAALIQSAFAGDQDAASRKARAIITLNAGAGIYVSGGAESLVAGIARADEVLGSGAAAEKLAKFVSFTQTLSAQPEGGSQV